MNSLWTAASTWVYIAHRGINVIVSGDVLQSKGVVYTLRPRSEKYVVERAASIGMSLDLLPYLPNLFVHTQGPRALLGLAGS
jgi:hypothetical protein